MHFSVTIREGNDRDHSAFALDMANGVQIDSVPGTFNSNYTFIHRNIKKFQDSLLILPYCEANTLGGTTTYNRGLVFRKDHSQKEIIDFSRSTNIYEIIHDIQSLPNGNIMVIYARSYGEPFNIWDADLVVYDKNLNIIFSKRFERPNYSGIVEIKPLSDKTFSLNESFYNPQLSFRSVLTKIDINGKTLSQWRLDTLPILPSISAPLIELDDGSIVFTTDNHSAPNGKSFPRLWFV